MNRVCGLLLVLTLMSGCTNDQLRYNTVKQAMTINEIQHRQVLQNLAAFSANQYTLPRHVNLHDGTAQITDNGSIAGQVINQTFLTIGGQRTIVDQWSMTPITNDVALRLLQLAYQRALGSPYNLYTSKDLANDFAHEYKKQTYQVDDLRTTAANRELSKLNSFWSRLLPTSDIVEQARPVYQTTAESVTDANGNTKIIAKQVIKYVGSNTFRAGYEKMEADKIRNAFDKIISSNDIDIVMDGEVLSQDNLVVAPIPGTIDKSGNPIYRQATPLVVELRRQVYETNKDLEDIKDTGWLGRSHDKHDVPPDACYVAYAEECGHGCHVWVCPIGNEGVRGLHNQDSQLHFPYQRADDLGSSWSKIHTRGIRTVRRHFPIGTDFLCISIMFDDRSRSGGMLRN